MACEEESEGLDEGESGTSLAVSVVKGDVFEGDRSVSSGGTVSGVLSGEGSASADESVPLNELMSLLAVELCE